MINRSNKTLILAAHITLLALLCGGCGGWWRAPRSASSAPPALPPAAPLAGEDDSNELAIRSLEDKVKADPLDYVGQSKLAGYYLARQRETGDTAYLDLAARAARASLAAAPVEVNSSGLAALAQTEFALHNFGAAREHAMRLVELDPRKSYPYRILGDALIELGDYDGATEAFAKMERLERFPTAASETRLARLAFLRGETDTAQRRLTRAVALALEESPVSRETVAWCRWQLGEIAFSAGDYETAERHDRDALTTFPNYYRALAGLGRALAARGDLAGAIEQYEQAVRVLPDPTFIAALGDLYQLAGRDKEAAAQRQLVEKIADLGTAKGALYDRQLALFYADHDSKAEQAYAIASKAYAARPDIYGADALAWTALKAGKIEEAREKIKEALRLGARDARLFYHAGMIARAAGDLGAAREQLRRALELSPQFDPVQAAKARATLAELSS